MTGVLIKGKVWQQSHTEGKSCEDTKRMPFTSEGMPEITRSWERGVEQILLHSP